MEITPKRHTIYLASSWRNERQPAVLQALRSWGHEVYDFRNPPNRAGFGWEQVCLPAAPGPADLVAALDHPVAREGFTADFMAMQWASAFVLLLDCGRSAHLELGWAAGWNAAMERWRPTAGFARKRCLVLAEKLTEPELMYLLCAPHEPAAHTLTTSLDQLQAQLAEG